MTTVPVTILKCVCKLRAVPKADTEMMVIRNVDTMKWLVRSVIADTAEEEAKAYNTAKRRLNEETEQYLSGIQHPLQFGRSPGFGMGDIGRRRL